MTPANVILSMIRKRLIAMNRYTELNVHKVFDALTDNGKNLDGAVMTSKPEVIAVLDKNIKEILAPEATSGRERSAKGAARGLDGKG